MAAKKKSRGPTDAQLMAKMGLSPTPSSSELKAYKAAAGTTTHTVAEYPVRYDSKGRPLAYRDRRGNWKSADYWRYSKEPPQKIKEILGKYPPQKSTSDIRKIKNRVLR